MSGLREDQYVRRFWPRCPEEVINLMETQVVWPRVETLIPTQQMRSCGRRATALGT
jgi:hypothetical protein